MTTNVLIALKQVQASVRVFSVLCKGVCVYIVYIVIIVFFGHSKWIRYFHLVFWYLWSF